jgi:uncharacterized phage-associated protein
MHEAWFASANGAWKFTPQARVMYKENKRVKTRKMQLFLDSVLFKWVRAIGIGKVRGLD